MRNATSFAKGEASATAGLLLSRRLVRRGSIAAADRLLSWLESNVTEDMRLSIARARLLEWRRRDPHKALTIVEAAQRRMPDQATELEHRRNRLRRKVESGRGYSSHRKRQFGQVQLEAALADGTI
jgi:hypothetical protein